MNRRLNLMERFVFLPDRRIGHPCAKFALFMLYDCTLWF